LLYLLGEHGDKIDNAPYLLEPLIDSVKSEQSGPVRLALLTATAKLFFRRPPEVQAMLGRLLARELSGEAPYQTEPHDRAMLYYRLLVEGVDTARTVIDAPRPPAVTTADAAEEVLMVRGHTGMAAPH
jgi:AP-4 complex subunit beta-1